MTERSELKLPDGRRVILGRVGPEDRDRVLRAWALMPVEDRRARFWTEGELPQRLVERLCGTDGESAAVWALLDPQRPDFPGLGGASWWRLEDDPTGAEFAVTVAPSERRCGVATLLEQACRRDAASRGVSHLVAFPREDNLPIRHWLRRRGARSRWDGSRIVWSWSTREG